MIDEPSARLVRAAKTAVRRMTKDAVQRELECGDGRSLETLKFHGDLPDELVELQEAVVEFADSSASSGITSWHAGFAAARYQAACLMGHFIVDEGGSIELATAAYTHLRCMEMNPECKQ